MDTTPEPQLAVMTTRTAPDTFLDAARDNTRIGHASREHPQNRWGSERGRQDDQCDREKQRYEV